MQPNEVKLIIDEITRVGLAYSWLPLIICIVGAGIGTYLGSYLGKKGENRATQENFDRIRDQLRATTEDTEEIKAILSGRAWRSQKQWAAAEQYYCTLLTHLHSFKLALSDLGDYFIEPGSEHTPDSQQGPHFRALQRSSNDSYRELKKLFGPAALYLSAPAMAALDSLAHKHWELATFSADCTADYVGAAHSLVSVAYATILSEGKAQLELAVGSA